MKYLDRILIANILVCICLSFSVQAQDFNSKIEIAQVEEETTPEEEKTRSYIGLGGTIGLSGDTTPLGEGGFSLIGRTSFTDSLSLHTSSIFQDDGLGLFSLTYGIPINNDSSEIERFFPFAGAGIAIEDLFGDFGVDPLITTGVDISISRNFVGTVRLNLTFPEDETNFGLLLGVGYRFSIFDLF